MSIDVTPFTQADLDALREQAAAVQKALDAADAQPLVYLDDADPFYWDGSRETRIVDGIGVLTQLRLAGWDLVRKAPK